MISCSAPADGRDSDAPAAPVSIAKCASYDDDLTAKLGAMFDQLGGSKARRATRPSPSRSISPEPRQVRGGKPLGVTHYTHPKLVGATAYLMGARARNASASWRAPGPPAVRSKSTCSIPAGTCAAAIRRAGVEFENTNALGKGKKYARFKVPGGGYMYPAYDLNHAYEDTDVYREHGEAEESRDLRRYALAEELLRHHAGLDLWRRRGRGRAEREPHQRAATVHQGKRQPRNRRRRNSLRRRITSPGIACRASWPTW